MDEIFGDSDVQHVFAFAGQGTVTAKTDDLESSDRQLFEQFVHADQDPTKLMTPAGLIAACEAGIKTFEQLSDPMPRSWAAGWQKFVLYITALNTQTLWDRFQKESGPAGETAVFADWVVSAIERSGWGPDGDSTPLGKQHSYCRAVAAEAGDGADWAKLSRYEAPGAGEPLAASRWGAARERVRQAQQHINPLVLQHGVESVQGALTESKIAKVDASTGKLKIRKLGVARAAIQPGRTLRRAVEGAALTDHLKAYGESATAAQRERTAAGGSSSAAEFASYPAKKDFLRDWARRLTLAAGASPTEQLVMQHADKAAADIREMVFLRQFGVPPGSVDSSQHSRGGTEASYRALETFDVLYASVVTKLVVQQQAVDEAIAAFLDSCWPKWKAEIRDRLAR